MNELELNVNVEEYLKENPNLTCEDIKAQLRLELEGAVMGEKRYKKQRLEWSLEDPKATPEADTKAGIVAMNKLIVPLAKGIEEWLQEVSEGKAVKYATAAELISRLDPELVALITLRGIINSMSREATIQETMTTVTNTLVDEVNYKLLQDRVKEHNKEAEDGDKDPTIFYLSKKFKKATREYTRSYMLHRVLDLRKQREVVLDPVERQKCFNILLDLTIKTTKLCETHRVFVDKNRSVTRIKPQKHIAEWFNEIHSRCALLSPIKLPMIIPPNKWTGIYSGGYISTRLKEPFVKVRNENFLEELEHWDMPDIYEAVNAIQATPWRINKRVFQVMKEVWDNNLKLGKLPMKELEPLPNRPVDIDENEESLKEWKRKASRIHELNNRNVGKRILTSQKLWLAEKFLNHEAIYFPHVCDWRGRIYPNAGVGCVNPQADDTGKALLEFAEGKRVGTQGVKWLKIHLANLFGIDKVSFDERIAWVDEHSFELRTVALDPLEYTFWNTADKPYQALAACLEYDEMMSMDNPEDFKSHLPIAMDGSNNGAQHLIALGRDNRAKVNLKPVDAPEDVYMDVVHEVMKDIKEIINKGYPKKKDYFKGKDKEKEEKEYLSAVMDYELAKLWDGKVSRSIAKRPVMTLSYGVTYRGMCKQIEEEVRKGNIMPQEMEMKASLWLAHKLFPAIERALPAAINVMNWLQDVAKVLAKHEIPTFWENPVGFPVLQKYRATNHKTVDSIIAGQRIQMRVVEEKEQLNKRKQSAGISPNFVHSLDASHLVKTVNRMSGMGINNFSMIHDSYGTHACYVDEMRDCLREEFVSLYKTNLLEDFLEQVKAQVPEKVKEELPEPPALGTLDISSVLQAEYFFA